MDGPKNITKKVAMGGKSQKSCQIALFSSKTATESLKHYAVSVSIFNPVQM